MDIRKQWFNMITLLLIVTALGRLAAEAATNFSKSDSIKESKVSSSGFGPGHQDWGYVNVRKGAHTFWWLYYTTANASQPTDRPLVLWLQGGPGASSTGLGNFDEIGPLDMHRNHRNHTWVKDVNVLFIDSPVGAGFSYVDNKTLYVKDNAGIVRDLLVTLKHFYGKLPAFKTVPLHIFAESYGGKVAMEFSYFLNKEIGGKKMAGNLKSVTSIDGWISPVDSMRSWAPYLYYLGMIDEDGYNTIMASALETQDAVEQHHFGNATYLWGITEELITNITGSVSFYNILKPRIFPKQNISEEDEAMDELKELMTGAVSDALSIPDHVEWGSQSDAAFDELALDFMKPVTNYVELLLNETTINVTIVTGQLDLIVTTAGTVKWIQRLRWPGADGYAAAKRQSFTVDNIIEGYCKRHKNLAIYWMDRAGHMVPTDNPVGMDYVLRNVTSYDRL